MQRDLSLFFLDRIARASEHSATSSRRARKEIVEGLEAVGEKIDELILWVKRLAIAASLWGSAGTIGWNAETIAQVLVEIGKRFLPGLK